MMRHIRSHELSGGGLAKQVIVAVHFHEQSRACLVVMISRGVAPEGVWLEQVREYVPGIDLGGVCGKASLAQYRVAKCLVDAYYLSTCTVLILAMQHLDNRNVFTIRRRKSSHAANSQEIQLALNS